MCVVAVLSCACRLSICCRNDVPPFGPHLFNPPTFVDPLMLRQFLLTKRTPFPPLLLNRRVHAEPLGFGGVGAFLFSQ